VDLILRAIESVGPASQQIEVVERKGLGHPDTVCDAVAEHVSVRLCKAYLERFGTILHHNVDKVLLVGGRSRPRFGGGEIIEPIEFYLAGRVTQSHGGQEIPVAEIAVGACREWLARNLPDLDVDAHVRVFPRFRAGSVDLTSLFARGEVPLANDTSCGAGFAPLTDLEAVVLEVERALNRRETKARHPELGQDVKVLGVRRDRRIDLTVGCAFVARFVRDAEDYAHKKELARDVVLEAARRVSGLEIDAIVNAADDVERGDVYLTVSGTSAEAGDDGEVGRGNRTNGLITPYRPMTLEAAAGKNPVSHVGKIYNLVAGRIAEVLAVTLPELSGAACLMVSRIGRPVAEPQIVDVVVGLRRGTDLAPLQGPVREVVRSELGRLAELRDALLAGRVSVC
jgi:S-adenosylmethionine synthetase